MSFPLSVTAIAKAREWSTSPAKAYARIKQQLRGPVPEKIERAITHVEDLVRESWFTPATTEAALAMQAGTG